MKLSSVGLGLLALVAATAPASAATVLYSADVPAGVMGALHIDYDAPASGFRQVFLLTYTGLAMDIDATNRIQYRQDNLLFSGTNDSATFEMACVFYADADSQCARALLPAYPFPAPTLDQTATAGQVTFVVTNPERVLFSGCTGLESYCYTEHGYSEGHGQIRGMLAPGTGGHVELLALDPTAVPEPATWGLLIAGFGLAGRALRRRANRPGRVPAAGRVGL